MAELHVTRRSCVIVSPIRRESRKGFSRVLGTAVLAALLFPLPVVASDAPPRLITAQQSPAANVERFDIPSLAGRNVMGIITWPNGAAAEWSCINGVPLVIWRLPDGTLSPPSANAQLAFLCTPAGDPA